MIPQPNPQQRYQEYLQAQQSGLLNSALGGLGSNTAFGWVWPTTTSTTSDFTYSSSIMDPRWIQNAVTQTRADDVMAPTPKSARAMPDDERWLRNRVAEIVKAGAL